MQVRVEKIYYLTYEYIKIEELMKVRFDGIANRIGKLSKSESESLLLEHLEWLEGGWETEEILFLKKPYRKWWF